MNIDPFTLWAVIGLTALISGIANSIICLSHLQIKGVGYWAIFSFLFVIGILFSVTVNVVDLLDWASFSDIIFFTAFTFLYVGVREIRSRQTHPWILLGGLWVFAVSLVYYASVISPDAELRIVIFSLYVALISVMCGYQLIIDFSFQSKGQLSLLIIFVSVSLFMISKVVALYGYELSLGSQGYDQWLIATGFVMQISLSWFIFSVVLIAAEKLQSELSQCGFTDSLTGLLNKKGFEEIAQRVLKRNQRSQTPVTLVIIDVDFFKDMNEAYGYEFANGILKKIANLISETVRFEDSSSRYQADVFFILIEGASKEDVLLPAQRILNALDEEDLIINGALVPCTVSIGIATSTVDKDFYDLVLLAHEALLEVKSHGGNGIKFHDTGL